MRGQSALTAGLLLAPQGIGMLFTRNMAGKLNDRIGLRPVVLAGFLLTLAGSVVFTQLGVHTSEIVLILSLVVRGTGLGAITIPVMSTAFLGLRGDQVPNASSTTRIAQQVGGSFGTAILGMILATALVTHHDGGLAGQASAFDTAFRWSLGLTAIAIIPAFALPRKTRTSAAAGLKSQGSAALSLGLGQQLRQPALARPRDPRRYSELVQQVAGRHHLVDPPPRVPDTALLEPVDRGGGRILQDRADVGPKPFLAAGRLTGPERFGHCGR